MGSDSSAHLAYGYDLGGDEHGWKFTVKGSQNPFGQEYCDPRDDLSWFGDDEDDGFAAQLVNELIRHAGWEETDWRIDKTYFKRKSALEKSLGVEVRRYGSFDYSGYILYTKEFNVEWGATPILEYVDPTWKIVLNAALDTLGIVPIQPNPCWILASFYG